MNTHSTHTRRRWGARCALVLPVALALIALGVAPAQAEMSSPAIVECDTARNTISVTPRVRSDHADQSQFVATRVWVATWDSPTRSWTWAASSWSIEEADARNDVTSVDTSRLDTQTLSGVDGAHHYVFVESYMWDGTTWYGNIGRLTTAYTLLTPSVSHESDTRTESAFCTL